MHKIQLIRSLIILIFIGLLFGNGISHSSIIDKRLDNAHINNSCDDIKRSLQKLIDDAVKDGLPGISLAIYKPACDAINLVSGLSDLSTNKLMTPQDHFRLASISKVYVGVVIMQMVQEGKISLDDPISKYLPKKYLINIKNSNRATVRQLMNHTSGISDYFGDRFRKDAIAHPGKLYSIDEALKFAYGKPAAFTPPGSDYFYSNTNPMLLGIIIEKLLQKPIDQVLRERIFTPLQLKQTYSDYLEPVIEPLSHGYHYDLRGGRTDYTEINQGYGLPDGVVVSNAQDMATFIRSLIHDEVLLKRETLKQMLTVDKAAKESQEALNIFVYQNYKDGIYGKRIGHDGEYAGYKSEMFYFPDKDVAIVLMTNSSGRSIHFRFVRLFDDIAATVLP